MIDVKIVVKIHNLLILSIIIMTTIIELYIEENEII